jgi:WD40 repeat protein
VRCGERVVGSVGSLCNFLISVGGRTLTGGQSGRLFDVETGVVLYQHWSPLNCAVIVGERLIVGTYTGEAVVFDSGSADGFVHVDTVRLHTNAVKGLATDGNQLFSVCATGAVAIHTLPGLDLARHVEHGHSRIANGAVALPDESFASVGRDLMLRLWSLDLSIAVTTPHLHSIKCVASSGSGRLLATGGYDGTVAVFDRHMQDWLSVLRPTTSGISSMIENPDAAGFLAASFDGHVYAIPVP